MRTKTLLLSAVLAVASAATSKADVFSVNVVGYVNTTVNLTNGFQMIANPLNNGDNTLQTLMTNVPDGTIVYKFAGGTFNESATFFGPPDNIWDPNLVLNPGEGAFIKVPSPTTITFVGEVPIGTKTNSYGSGFSIRSSIVPQSGGLSTALGFPARDGDVIYQFTPATQSYSANTFFGAPDNIWDPAEPTPAVGEAFFISTGGATNWIRTFNP